MPIYTSLEELDQYLFVLKQAKCVGRRSLLQVGSLCAAATLISPIPSFAREKLTKTIRIGLISDLHHDLIPDAKKRLEAFADAMRDFKPDAVLQLGDFAYPKKENQEIADLFNQISTSPLHVIGNHDLDSGHTRNDCQNQWGISGPYYACELHGLLIVVLDGNDKDSPNHRGGYPSYIGLEQQEWLKNQLSRAMGPVMIVSHQPIAGPSAIDNASEIQGILSQHADKILLALNGHTHIDKSLELGGVRYVHINSASYYWVGGGFKHNSYPQEAHRKYPYLSSTCPYQEPLFGTLTIDPAEGTLQIVGKTSDWLGKSPASLEVPAAVAQDSRESVVPAIRDRQYLFIP